MPRPYAVPPPMRRDFAQVIPSHGAKISPRKKPPCSPHLLQPLIQQIFPPSLRVFISRQIQKRTTLQARSASKRADGQERKFTEVNDALDDFCHPLSAVVSGRSFVVHPGGIYSHPSRGRSSGAGHSTHYRQKGGLTSAAATRENRRETSRMRKILTRNISSPAEHADGTTKNASQTHRFEVNP
jgi:hypothetical protein